MALKRFNFISWKNGKGNFAKRRLSDEVLQDVAGLKVFYREAGDPSKPTIVLLHGFPTSSYQFHDLIPLLADRFHVIAPDYPGMGYSDAPAEWLVADPMTKSENVTKYELCRQEWRRRHPKAATAEG